MRRIWLMVVAAALVLPMGSHVFADSEDVAHKIVFHIVENDKSKMSEALDNIENVFAHYEEKGERTLIEVIAYAGGIEMLRADTSPVRVRLDQMMLLYEDLRLVGCGRTVASLEKHHGEIPLIDDVEIAPTGVAYLIELQEQGYAYVKP